MLRDVRLAARMLLQAKGWTAVVLVSLALGIGANTALFSAINGLLLRRLPVHDPDTLVRFRHAGPNEVRTDVLIYGSSAPDARGREPEATFSYPMYEELVAANRTMSDLVAFAPIGLVGVVVNGQADVAEGFFASGNYYRALGVTAHLGRTIVPDDDRPTAPPVAVISHKYWMARFGGNPEIVGTPARINNGTVTIVGVLPPGFTGVDRVVTEAPDISVPLVLEPQVNLERSSLQSSLMRAPNFWWLHMMGRLKPGVTFAQVEGNLSGVFQQAGRAGFVSFLSSLPAETRSRSFLQGSHTAVPDLLVDSGSHGIYEANPTDLRAITMLTAIVALVLMIVCANVANLVLSRSTARRKEVSVRLALGATRARLIRQLLTESLLLASIGGALGLLIGRWGQTLLPAGQTSPFDWRVMAFAAGLTMTTGVVFGIAPALRATRTDVNASLKETSRSVARSRGLLGRSLVVAQVAISLVLLVGAALFLRTLENLRHVDVGFNPRNVLLFRVSPTLYRYAAERRNPLYAGIGQRLSAIPGVQSVAWSNPPLMSGRQFRGDIFVQGRAYARGQHQPISLMVVSPAFFETMEMPMRGGRRFTPADTEHAPPVVIINEAAARKYFSGEPAIGRRFGQILEESGKYEVVGVVRDATYNDVRQPPAPTMYLPSLQDATGSVTFEVRTAGDPLLSIGAVRDAVRQVDPNLPLINVTTQMAAIDNRFLQEKIFAQAYTLFGGLALIIASIGLFGLMSYSVVSRTNEIGIRMALGAQQRDVLRQVMGESTRLVAAGVVFGIAGAVTARQLVSSLLFGLAPADPLSIAGAVTVMLLVSSLAGYLPARRAARVDPMVALRRE